MGKREEQKTRWQNVLRILIDYKKTGKTFNLATAPDGTAYGREPVGEGWLPVWAFTGPYVGGSEGGKRQRELRYKFGIPIEKMKHYWKSVPEKFTWLYRLGCLPDKIDIENICLKPKSVEPERKSLEQLSLTI